jgi:hypothetical protein
MNYRAIQLSAGLVILLGAVALDSREASAEGSGGEGGIGWCGWRNFEGGSEHNFYMANNMACMTNSHTMTIPGHCEGGGATHAYVPGACAS